MNDPSDPSPPKTPAEVLSELVARKAAARSNSRSPAGADPQSERAAAARSAAKSKPAMRR